MNVATDGKYVPWKAMIFVSCAMVFSGSLMSADFGIVTTLMKVLAPITAGIPAIVLIIIGTIITVFLTNIMSNVVTCFVMLSVFIPVLTAAGVDNALIQATSALFIAVSSLACASPSGSPGIGLVMGVEIDNKGLFKYTIVFIIAMIILMMATILPIGSILYK